MHRIGIAGRVRDFRNWTIQIVIVGINADGSWLDLQSLNRVWSL